MNRRQFLVSLGIGAPAAVLAAKVGLLERVRSYFFAPRSGWGGLMLDPYPGRLCTPTIAAQINFSDMLALRLDAIRPQLAELMLNDHRLFEMVKREDAIRMIAARSYFLGTPPIAVARIVEFTQPRFISREKFHFPIEAL